MNSNRSFAFFSLLLTSQPYIIDLSYSLTHHSILFNVIIISSCCCCFFLTLYTSLFFSFGRIYSTTRIELKERERKREKKKGVGGERKSLTNLIMFILRNSSFPLDHNEKPKWVIACLQVNEIKTLELVLFCFFKLLDTRTVCFDYYWLKFIISVSIFSSSFFS